MTPEPCERSGGSSPCADPGCACHTEAWDRAFLAFVAIIPPAGIGATVESAMIAADKAIEARASRASRARARVAVPSKAWDD